MPKIVDLYGESGAIAIGLTEYYDICATRDSDCVVTVKGHRLYCCPADEARQRIRSAYLVHAGIADPLLELYA